MKEKLSFVHTRYGNKKTSKLFFDVKKSQHFSD